MKNALFAAGLLVLSLTSCTKTYVCKCSSTVIYYNNNSGNLESETFPGETKSFSEKMTKKQAQAACANEATVIQTSLMNYTTDNGTFPLRPGEGTTTNCSIL